MPKETEEDWSVLLSLFPEGWEQQAKETGAMERQRGIKIPETLLRLFLLRWRQLRPACSPVKAEKGRRRWGMANQPAGRGH